MDFLNISNLVKLLIVILFIILSYFVYNKYIKEYIEPKYVDNKEYIKTPEYEKDKEATLLFFYADWCPVCREAKPEWEKFKDYLKDKNYNVKNTKIKIVEVDTSKDEATTEKYKVESIPTIKLKTNNNIVNYVAKVNKDSLVIFLDSSL